MGHVEALAGCLWHDIARIWLSINWVEKALHFRGNKKELKYRLFVLSLTNGRQCSVAFEMLLSYIFVETNFAEALLYPIR